MRNKHTDNVAEELGLSPENALYAQESAAEIKKLSNTFCLSLFTQPFVAVAIEAAALIIYAFYSIVILRSGFGITQLMNISSMKSASSVALTCIEYFSYMFVPFMLIVFLLREDPLTAVPAGRIKDRSLIIPAVACGLILSFASDLISQYIQTFLSFVHLKSSAPDFSLPGTPAAFALYFFEICIMAPFCEEFIFRGIILGNLRPFGNKFAVLVSALLFAMMHGNLLQIPLAFVVGLGLGIFVIKSGSIWLTVLMHACVNLTSVLVSLLSSRFGDAAANIAYLSLLLLAGAAIAAYLPGISRSGGFRAWLRRHGGPPPECGDVRQPLPLGYSLSKFAATPGFMFFAAMTIISVVFYTRVI